MSTIACPSGRAAVGRAVKDLEVGSRAPPPPLACQDSNEVRQGHVQLAWSRALSLVDESNEVVSTCCPHVVRQLSQLPERFALFSGLHTANGTKRPHEGGCALCNVVHSSTVPTTTDVRAYQECVRRWRSPNAVAHIPRHAP